MSLLAPKGPQRLAVGASPRIRTAIFFIPKPRKGRHKKGNAMSGTYSDLLFHIVFGTKNRIALIDDLLQPDLYDYIGGIIRGQNGTLLQIGGMSDHVHLLVRLRPTNCLSDLLREIKSSSSRWVNEEKWKLRKFGWQDGFAAFTVSRSQAPSVQQYIQDQRQRHQNYDYQQELVYLWD
jgi:REP element-mobilizing transposase RayT